LNYTENNDICLLGSFLLPHTVHDCVVTCVAGRRELEREFDRSLIWCVWSEYQLPVAGSSMTSRRPCSLAPRLFRTAFLYNMFSEKSKMAARTAVVRPESTVKATFNTPCEL